MNSVPHYISEGTGRPLIFQHGLTANTSQIQNLLGGLTATQLICMDCPGHGHSKYPSEKEVSFNYYTDELIRLMDHLKIERSMVGGLSMGTGIALNMSIRYPDRVRGLILLRPAWLHKSTPDNLQIIATAASYLGKPEGLNEFKKEPSFALIETENKGAAASILGVFSEQQQLSLKTVITQMVADHPFNDLEEIDRLQTPCLIIANEYDPIHPYKMAEKIHECFQDSILKKVTSRYLDPELHKKQVRSLVTDFIKHLEFIK